MFTTKDTLLTVLFCCCRRDVMNFRASQVQVCACCPWGQSTSVNFSQLESTLGTLRASQAQILNKRVCAGCWLQIRWNSKKIYIWPLIQQRLRPLLSADQVVPLHSHARNAVVPTTDCIRLRASVFFPCEKMLAHTEFE